MNRPPKPIVNHTYSFFPVVGGAGAVDKSLIGIRLSSFRRPRPGGWGGSLHAGVGRGPRHRTASKSPRNGLYSSESGLDDSCLYEDRKEHFSRSKKRGKQMECPYFLFQVL